MLYNYEEFLNIFKTDYKLKKAINNKMFFKLKDGIYSDKPSANFLSILKKEYPYCVISGHSAYYFYGFTDVIPQKITVCTPRNATNIKNSEIKQIRMKDELYELGITSYEHEGIDITIYDKERLLIDLARNKNKMGYDLYKEIIINYRRIAESLDMYKIEKYLEHFKDSDRIYKILMSEVF